MHEVKFTRPEPTLFKFNRPRRANPNDKRITFDDFLEEYRSREEVIHDLIAPFERWSAWADAAQQYHEETAAEIAKEKALIDKHIRKEAWAEFNQLAGWQRKLPYRHKKIEFKPAARGSVAKVVAEPQTLAKVAPESPRPPAMLSGMSISRGVDLTEKDLALHEIMLSHAYQIDPDFKEEEYRLDLDGVQALFGQNTKKEEIKSAAARLSDIRVDFEHADQVFKRSPLLHSYELELKAGGSFICFSFPKSIKAMMNDMPRYAHIELAPIVQSFSSRYSHLLYKALADRVSEEKWVYDHRLINRYEARYTPCELVDILSFPKGADGTFNSGKLVAAVERGVSEMKDVKRFSVEMDIRRGTGRGRPIECFIFTIEMLPKALHMLPAVSEKARMRAANEEKAIEFYQAKGGDPYAPLDSIFGKASLQFCTNDFLNTVEDKEERHFLRSFPGKMRECWSLAITEALDQHAITVGYYSRQYRGQRLLDTIEKLGIDQTCFNYLEDEVRFPDLRETPNTLKNIPYSLRGYLIAHAELKRARRAGNGIPEAEQLVADWACPDKERYLESQGLLRAVRPPVVEPVIEPVKKQTASGLSWKTCRQATVFVQDDIDQFDLDQLAIRLRTCQSGARKFDVLFSGNGGSIKVSIQPSESEWRDVLEAAENRAAMPMRFI